MKSSDLIPEHVLLTRLGGPWAQNDPVFLGFWREFELKLTRYTLPGGFQRWYSWAEVLSHAVVSPPNDPYREPLPRRGALEMICDAERIPEPERRRPLDPFADARGTRPKGVC